MKQLLCLLAVVGSIGCGQGFDYSDGARVGTIIKFSKKGVVCKTWEGTMVLGGGRAVEGGAVANTWDFSVLDTTLVPTIEHARDSGDRVKLSYREGSFTGACISESSYFVNAVEVTK